MDMDSAHEVAFALAYGLARETYKFGPAGSAQ